MKNILVASLLTSVVLLCGSGVARAQHYGDTLRRLPDSYITPPCLNLDQQEGVHQYSVYREDSYFGEWRDFCRTDSIERVNEGAISMSVLGNTYGLQTYNVGNFIHGIQMVTDRPIKILGIAACATMETPRDTTIPYFLRRLVLGEFDNNDSLRMLYTTLNTRDTSRYSRITDSMILYKPTPDGMMSLISAPWRIEQPHNHIVLPPQISAYVLNEPWIQYNYPFSSRNPDSDFWDGLDFWSLYESDFVIDTAPVASLYEAMFDKPVVVEDSFVVAGTALNNDGSFGWVTIPAWERYQPTWMWMWLFDHSPTRYWMVKSFGLRDSTNTVMWRKYRHHEWKRIASNKLYITRHSEWANDTVPRIRHADSLFGYGYLSFLIFPIIDPDFDTLIEHCQPVENVRVASSNDTSATLIWDASNSERWEVRYGIMGMDWEDYFEVNTTVPTATLTGLQTGLQYRVFVRGWCACDSSWGEWVEGRRFTPQRREGVESPGNLGRFTRLVPNPAREVVNVLSSYRMERIAVYDLNGRKVVEQEADGISAIVDVSMLPKGTYITAIYLPHGVATKKLMVE